MLSMPARCMRHCCCTLSCPRPCRPDSSRRLPVTSMAAERQAPHAVMHVGQVSWEASLPYQGNISGLQQQPTLQALHHLLQEAVRVLEAYHAVHPGVVNLPKLVKRVRREVDFVAEQLQATQQQPEQKQVQQQQQQQQQQQEQQQQQATAAGVGEQEAAEEQDGRQKMLQGRLQGVVNNLRGFHGEIMALLELPGVTAVSARMRAPRPAVDMPTPSMPGGGRGPSGSTIKDPAVAVAAAVDAVDGEAPHQQLHVPTAAAIRVRPVGAGGGPGPQAVKGVEVDVVGHGGCCWVEVKHQEVFGIDSVHWKGSPGHGRGLAAQVANLLAAAAHPPNWRCWRVPSVVVYWPGGVVDAGVAAALRDMGALVAVGPGSLSTLPLPPPPAALNLDTTTVCGLVSGVSTGAGRGVGMDERLDAWAARTVHWRDCLAEERRQPLLQELAPHFTAAWRLLAAAPAVTQFELLLRQFGGPGERARWRLLKQHLEVYDLEGDSGRFVLVQQQQHDDSLQQQQGQQQHGQQGEAPLQQQGQQGQQGQQQDQQQQGNQEQQELELGPEDPLVQLLSSMGQAAAPEASLPVPAASSGLNGSSDANGTGGSAGIISDKLSSSYENGTGHNGCGSQQVYQQPGRVAGLSALTQQQRAVLGLGDAAQALTLTANGGALRLACSVGVVLEAVTHRAVWLTGM